MLSFTINDLLAQARKIGASDLHVAAGAEAKCRVHGELRKITREPLSAADTAELIMPMVPERLRASLDETGEADFSHAIPGNGRFRVNVLKQKGALGTVIRLISTEIPSAESLGLPPSVVELTKKKRGSGKSTTLASLIDIINTERAEHIITMEDPIEYEHFHKASIINQREVGMDTMSFSAALRAALREDPDVILVGEMRDLETISSAITAAETGHLVFSTLHTIGAAATVDRVIDVFPPHQQQQIRVQLANVLISVISQSLIPTRDGKGRVAAFEIMHTIPAIQNLIRENKTHQISSTIQTSKNMGMITMDDAIYKLYNDGKIDSTQALEFAQDPDQLRKKLY